MGDVIKNRTELIQRIWEKLGNSAAGQTIPAEASTFINNNLASAVRQLTEDRIVFLANLDQIPVEVFDDTATLIADRNFAKDYGMPMDTPTAMQAERRLRRLFASKPTGEVLRAEFF